VLFVLLVGCTIAQRDTPPDAPPDADTVSPWSPAAQEGATSGAGAGSLPDGAGSGASPDGSASEPASDCLLWARSLPQASLVHPPLQWQFPRYVTEGTCRLHVHSEAVTVDLVLPPAADPEAAQAALQLTGEPELSMTTSSDGEHVFTLRFPAGEPGERLTVRLAGPFGPAGEQVDLGFDLERVATPRVALDYRTDGGDWLPVEPGSTLPRRPMELRLRPVGGVDPERIAQWLGDHGLAYARQADALIVRLADPPTHLVLNLNDIPAEHGLLTSRSFLELFTGEEPQVSLLDPATGQEQALRNAPVNIYASEVAPSGGRVALMATDPLDPYGTQIWVLDLRTGDLHRTGISLSSPWYRIYWRPDELVVADHNRIHRWREGAVQATVQVSRGRAFDALSPDGRFLAGLAIAMTEVDEKNLAPASIVLHDLETGAERILAERQIKVLVPPNEKEPRLQLSFSADGAGLLIREPAPGTGGWRYLRLDIGSDTLADVPEPPAAGQQEWIPGPGGLAYRVQTQPYGDVMVRDGDGMEQAHGSGHIVGWLPDGRLLLIRWANGPWLRRPWFI